MPTVTPENKHQMYEAYGQVLARYASIQDPVERLRVAIEARGFCEALAHNLERDLDSADRAKRCLAKIKSDGGKAEKELRRIEKDTIDNLNERLVAAVKLYSGGSVDRLGKAVSSVEELLRSGPGNEPVKKHLEKAAAVTRDIRERHRQAAEAAASVAASRVTLEKLNESSVYKHTIKTLSK